jgi:hypothetical protein
LGRAEARVYHQPSTEVPCTPLLRTSLTIFTQCPSSPCALRVPAVWGSAHHHCCWSGGRPPRRARTCTTTPTTTTLIVLLAGESPQRPVMSMTSCPAVLARWQQLRRALPRYAGRPAHPRRLCRSWPARPCPPPSRPRVQCAGPRIVVHNASPRGCSVGGQWGCQAGCVPRGERPGRQARPQRSLADA